MNRMVISLWLMGACMGAGVGSASAQVSDTNAADLGLDSLLNIEISTAAKYAQTSREAPATVTVVTSEDIERYGYHTLDDVLASVRGFYVSNDRNYSYIGVRGFSRPTDYNNRILLLLNGHSLNENVYGSAAVGTDLALDLDGLDRIEIVRGPGSALYGTNAVFAVINLITKKGSGIDGLRISGDGGSYGHRRGTALFGRRLTSGVDLSVSGVWGAVDGQRLYYKEYDDLATNFGIAENLDWDSYRGGAVTATYKRLTLQGCGSLRRKGIPTGPWGTDFNNPDALTSDRRQFAELKYDDRWGVDKHLMLRTYYDDYSYYGSYPTDGVAFLDASDGRWLGTEGQFYWDLRTNNRLTLGAEYQHHLRADYRTYDENTGSRKLNVRSRLTSAYVQDELQLTPQLAFTVGIRHDYYSAAGHSTTPRAAVVITPSRSGILKLLYGEAFRAPNVYESWIEGGGLKGNPNLRAERMRMFEVAWEQRFTHQLWGTASLYHYIMKDLIDQTIDPVDSLLQFRNVSRAEAKGLELEVDARLRSGISGSVSYALGDADDPDRHEDLSNSPHHLVRMTVACNLWRQLGVAARGQYEGSRITVQRTKTGPSFLAGVGLSLRPRHQKNAGAGGVFDRVGASLWVNNLFDASYQTPGGLEHRQPAITQNGRNVILKLQYEI